MFESDGSDLSCLSKLKAVKEEYVAGQYKYHPIDEPIDIVLVPDDEIIDNNAAAEVGIRLGSMSKDFDELKTKSNVLQRELDRWQMLEKWLPKCGSLRISKEELKRQIWKSGYMHSAWKPERRKDG